MIRLAVHFLLILAMLANHGLLLAHAHPGADLTEPNSYGSRPHFHVGGHSHSHATGSDTEDGHSAQHRHATRRPDTTKRDRTDRDETENDGRHHHTHDATACRVVQQRDAGERRIVAAFVCSGPADHDGDAVYGADAFSWALKASPIGDFPADLYFAVPSDVAALDGAVQRSEVWRTPPASLHDAACPIYLRKLSLRI